MPAVLSVARAILVMRDHARACTQFGGLSTHLSTHYIIRKRNGGAFHDACAVAVVRVIVKIPRVNAECVHVCVYYVLYSQ